MGIKDGLRLLLHPFGGAARWERLDREAFWRTERAPSRAEWQEWLRWRRKGWQSHKAAVADFATAQGCEAYARRVCDCDIFKPDLTPDGVLRALWTPGGREFAVRWGWPTAYDFASLEALCGGHVGGVVAHGRVELLDPGSVIAAGANTRVRIIQASGTLRVTALHGARVELLTTDKADVEADQSSQVDTPNDTEEEAL